MVWNICGDTRAMFVRANVSLRHLDCPVRFTLQVSRFTVL